MKKKPQNSPRYQSKRAGKVKKAHSPKACKARDRRREKAKDEAGQERAKHKKEAEKLHNQAPKEKPQFNALTQAVMMTNLVCGGLDISHDLTGDLREEMHKTLLSQSTKTPTIKGIK